MVDNTTLELNQKFKKQDTKLDFSQKIKENTILIPFFLSVILHLILAISPRIDTMFDPFFFEKLHLNVFLSAIPYLIVYFLLTILYMILSKCIIGSRIFGKDPLENRQ